MEKNHGWSTANEKVAGNETREMGRKHNMQLFSYGEEVGEEKGLSEDWCDLIYSFKRLL